MIENEKPRNLGLLGAILVLVAILCMALRSWRAWGDPVIDFPQQLYIAWRIAAGEVLYRDIQYFYGPFSQLFNGALFYTFGPGYFVVSMANLFLAAVISLLIYLIVWRAFDWASGLIAALAFVLIHMFNPYSCFSFLAPYSHEATHGTFFLLVIIALSAKTSGPRDHRIWILLGLASGLIVFTKPEFILASALIIGANIFIDRRSSSDFFWKSFIGLLGGISIPFLCVFAYFTIAGKFSLIDAFRAIFASINPTLSIHLAKNPLYKSALGTDEYFGSNLIATFKALGLIILFLGLSAGIDTIKQKNQNMDRDPCLDWYVDLAEPS